MPVGKEQFERAITVFRNLHIVAGISPLVTMRQEVVGNDEFTDRGGTDDPTQTHFQQLLINADRIRRRLTHNPDNIPLGKLIEDAIDVKQVITPGQKPFGGDDVQTQSGGLIDLPFALDGSDPDIPLNSKLRFKNPNAVIFLGAIDRAIVNWTRLNSRDRTTHITAKDSLRVYGNYQQILGFINDFMGDANRVDVANVLPSDEPLGPESSPNFKSENAGGPGGIVG